MDNITFGRYSPYNTFVHKLDPRNKLLLVILLMVSIFLRFNVWSTTLIVAGLLFIFLIVIMIISKVRIVSLLKSILGMWLLFIFLLIIYVVAPNTTYTHYAFNIYKLKVYWDAFYQAGYIIIRIITMLGLTMVLTSTTKPMDLTYGLEWYISPLKVIKFPAHILAMVISITLRYIPTLLEETNRIMKAQASRGVDFSRGGLLTKIKSLISLIIPLLFSAFQKSSELAEAMEVRGYDPNEKRTRYHKLTFTYRDLIAFLLAGGVFAAVLTFMIIDKNTQQIDLIYLIFKVNIGW